MALKLYTYLKSKNAYKALITAEYVKVAIELPEFQFGVTNKTPEFLALNPIGKVPTLETPNGGIFESNAIARYIARLSDTGLFGDTLLDMAQVEAWIDFATNELDSNLYKWGVPLLRASPANPRFPQVEEAAIAAVKRALGALDTRLKTRTFVVGNAVTLADIILACSLSDAFARLLDKSFTSAFPHVERYFWTLVNQPEFKKVMGEIEQIAKTPTEPVPASATPAPAAKATPVAAPSAPAPKEAAKPKEKAKEAKPKEEPKAKAAPAPAPAPAPAAAAEEEEAPKKKAPNPLDSLPPSTMVMDNWKRLYSNTKVKDFREVAIKGFWDMYDAEGYSLWFCEYKHNEENTVPFITMNKVGGFLQRMDFIRKHGFGKMCILGKSPFQIKGVWLFRGTGMPQMVLDECYDVELYTWVKVDVSDKKQKDRVSDMFEETEKIDGLEVVEVKCFK